MSFSTQLVGFVKRNLILKYRYKFQTLPELYYPAIMLSVLIVFYYTFKPASYGPVEYTPQYMNNLSQRINYRVFMSPNNLNTSRVGEELAKSRFLVEYFDTAELMKSEYLNRTSNLTSTGNASLLLNRYFGVEWTSFPYEYKIYNQWTNGLFQNNKVLITGNGQLCRDPSDLDYSTCGGNYLAFNGFSFLQNQLNLAIKKVDKIV